MNAPSVNTICAMALRTLRNACEDERAEHFTSTLHEPASPISLTRLAKALAIVVKTWAAPETRSVSEAGSRSPGTKNSMVWVSPSVSGDHQAAARSATSPTRTGPGNRPGAWSPKTTIWTSPGTFARSMARRIAPACGDDTAACAAKPPGTADHARSFAVGSAAAASGARTTPITRRFVLRRFACRMPASSLSVIGDRTTFGASCARRSCATATPFGTRAGSPGTEGICAMVPQAATNAAPASRRASLARSFRMSIFRPAERGGVPLRHSPQHVLGGRDHRGQLDRVHAARLGAFVQRADTAAHPLDPAAKQDRLVAAWERIEGEGALRHVAPEAARPAQHRRARPVQRDGRSERRAAHVGDPRVRRHEERRARQQPPHLRKVERAAVRPIAALGIAGGDDRVLAAPAAPYA